LERLHVGGVADRRLEALHVEEEVLAGPVPAAVPGCTLLLVSHHQRRQKGREVVWLRREAKAPVADAVAVVVLALEKLGDGDQLL